MDISGNEISSHKRETYDPLNVDACSVDAGWADLNGNTS